MADHELTDDYDGENERIQGQKDRMDALKRRIDVELRTARPDRYAPGDAFLDVVAERVRADVPILLAQEMLARDLVGRREGQATKRVNKFLRGIAGMDGQYALPVDWYVYADEPVAITVPVTDDHGEVLGRRWERVALRAVNPADWLNFVSAGREDAQQRHDAEMRMYDAAEWCALQQGQATFAEWAEAVQPNPEAESA